MGKISGKECILAILFIFVSIAAFWFWQNSTIAIANESFSSYAQFVASITAFVLATALFGIAAIFIKNPVIIYSSTIIGVGVPFLFIPSNAVVLSVMAFNMLLLVFAVRRTRNEFNLSRGFNLAQLFKAGVPLFMTVAGITTSMFYLNEIQTKDAVKAIFPRTIFNITIQALGGPLRSLTGNIPITPDETVDYVLHGLIQKQLESKGIHIEQISNAELQRLYAVQRDEIARSYGIKLTGKEKLGDVFYTTIIDRISDLLGPYRRYVPYASAFTFFFAFKTLSLLLYFVALACAFLLIKIMIYSKILKREKQQIEVEHLTLN